MRRSPQFGSPGGTSFTVGDWCDCTRSVFFAECIVAYTELLAIVYREMFTIDLVQALLEGPKLSVA